MDKTFDSFVKKMKSAGPGIFIFESEYVEFRSKTLYEREIFKKEERRRITPVALEMVRSKGYKVDDIKGTGENGRIIKADVENHHPKFSLW